MAKAGIPGAAVAVVVGDTVVWARGFGVANAETGAPVTPDTLFQIGSVTKSFTAAAILTAASQGAIALDKPVANYISGLTPCVGAPTLTQLLSHTGGIIDEPDEFGPQGEEGLGAYQRTWTNEYCFLPPGRAFSYSNSGFSLAGLALQEVDKKPFADVMRARVLAPLGMTRTTFRPMEAMTWPLAVGHRKNKEGKFEVVRPLANDARLWPAGTLYSSANEMARFVTALMNDGKLEGKQALPVGLAAKMREVRARIPPTLESYGSGLFVMSVHDVGHGGAMTGYAAQFTIGDAPGAGVVVLTNAEGVNPIGLSQLVRNLALDTAPVKAVFAELQRRAARLGPPPPPISHGLPPANYEIALPVDAARRYVGAFTNPRRFTVQVVEQGDGLVLRRFGRDFPMRALTYQDQFLVDLPRGGTETIAFGLGADGRADYLQMNVWALARVP
jgi:CubicO group peptidase (beta-lactamase class C family)